MIKVIETSNAKEFEAELNDYINFGYKILSCNCGFVNSEQYDFANCYQAILEKLATPVLSADKFYRYFKVFDETGKQVTVYECEDELKVHNYCKAKGYTYKEES